VTPWKGAVRTKFAVLGLAWLLWFVMSTVAYACHFAFLASGGRARTMVQADRGIARAMVVGFALVLAIETCSVAWRAARHSSRIGVTGIAVAGLCCTAPLLFAFTPIGFVLLPFAALAVFLALPIGGDESDVANGRLPAPAGWYSDPVSGTRLRYWDGMTWTPWTA
jgi:hypothetical protein